MEYLAEARFGHVLREALDIDRLNPPEQRNFPEDSFADLRIEFGFVEE